MDIVALERKYADFYAPHYLVEVAGTDLTTRMEVTSVEVDHSLGAASRFSVVAAAAYTDETRKLDAALEDLHTIEVGQDVRISAGYVTGRPPLELLITGVITSVNPSFPSGGHPQVTLSGYDYSYLMTKGARSDFWEKKTDSAVVAELARRYNLTAKATDSGVVHPMVRQSQQSDYQFVLGLADRNDFVVFADDRDLHFKPRTGATAAVVELGWGSGLLSFTPEINLADQVTEVEVIGWDPATKQEIVGRAGSNDIGRRAAGQDAGPQALGRLWGDKAKLTIRRSVYSKQEAERLARSILVRRADGFVTGSGEFLGVPILRPDTVISLTGLGRRFSRAYYVEQTTHNLSPSGYMTTFRVKEATG